MTDDARAIDRDCGADAAAYALGALEVEEAQAFARHIATCVVCRDEVAAFRGVTDGLPLAAAQMPAPRRLKRSLTRSVRLEPKAVRASTGRGRGRWHGARMRSAFARPALAATAALTVLAGVIAAVELSSEGPSSTQLHARVIQASVAIPHANAILRVSGGRAEIVVRHFPLPPAGKVYEVWLKRGGRAPAPTDALFSVTSTGSGAVNVPGGIRGVNEVLVTPERLGGSMRPTHAPVIVAQVG